jgi:hypothetical protein
VRNILIFIGALFLYHYLFWEQAGGLNLVVFSWLMVGIGRWQAQGNFTQTDVLFGLLILSASWAWFTIHSALSAFGLIFSSLAYISFSAYRLSSVFEVLVNSPALFLRLKNDNILPTPIKSKLSGKWAFALQVSLVPLLIYAIFYGALMAGNSVLRSWSENYLSQLVEWLDAISPSYLLFILFGFFLLRGAFAGRLKSWFQLGDSGPLSPGKEAIAEAEKQALKRSYWSALIILVSLNGLFLIANYIDVRWVWFQFDLPAGFSLKEFVHDGVGWLIFSLVLSASVLLFYFRAALNFHPNSKLLRSLAIAWVVQNIILAISVVLRTLYYIGFHGLAYGRLAVLLWLSVVILGMVLLIVKLATKRANSFIYRHVSNYSMLLLVLAGLVDWDKRIVRYNLDHPQANEIDVDGYLSLSPRVYPILFDEIEKVQKQINKHAHNEVRWISYENIEDFKDQLERQSKAYLRREAEQQWPAFNWADNKTSQALALRYGP